MRHVSIYSGQFRTSVHCGVPPETRLIFIALREGGGVHVVVLSLWRVLAVTRPGFHTTMVGQAIQ